MRLPYRVLIISVILLMFVGWLDYTTGPELGFFVFYFIPLALVAWHGNAAWCMFFSILASIVWLEADIYAGQYYTKNHIGYWNAGIRFLAFLCIALMTNRVRSLLTEERRLNEELTKAASEIKVLSGLLPVCASCKKIRNEQGAWKEMEVYISEHSEADFSHGICEECAKRLYPEYVKGEEG